ncbi:MAG: hypothetical protein H0V00_11075 [Chloroflexia bacterium]|nr:hypothetical protein [Chloroflexia bacterium]
MIAFPAVAAVIAFMCAGFVGWDAVRRPRPERAIWTVAFLVFAIAATTEVIGAVLGWSPALARVYYLCGAVLVVGILALGELYLIFADRVPAIVPGLTLLVAAIAATAVWTAPVLESRLVIDGWRAIERGPFLSALAIAINAGGTLVLAGGALYSAFALRTVASGRQRAVGCLLIAAGTVVVALGGTLARFGRPEYLYLAMALGIAIIFAGVMLTRGAAAPVTAMRLRPAAARTAALSSQRARVVSLPARHFAKRALLSSADEGIQYIVDVLLPLDDEAIAESCRRWSASRIDGDALTRTQARQVWTLRILLPPDARERYDRLPVLVQAQMSELFDEVWSGEARADRDELHA